MNTIRHEVEKHCGSLSQVANGRSGASGSHIRRSEGGRSETDAEPLTMIRNFAHRTCRNNKLRRRLASPAARRSDAPAQEDQAAFRTLSLTRRPAAAAMFTRASNPNTSILPRIKSETRGWVTPKSLAI